MKSKLYCIIALVLSVVLALSFASCGGSKSDSSAAPDDDAPLVRDDSAAVSVPEGDQPGLPDFGAIMSGNGGTDKIWSAQDESTKQALVEAARQSGCEVTFGADGSTVIKDPEGNTFIQTADGAWTSHNDDGSTTQIGGNWPDNEFTRLLPKPEFALLGASSSETEFSVAFQSVSVEQIKDYAEKVKARGFTVDAQETDQNSYGVAVYYYEAYNADGYYVSISFAAGSSAVMISKEE